MKNKLFKPI